MKDLDENEAASIIQSTMRGYKTRKTDGSDRISKNSNNVSIKTQII